MSAPPPAPPGSGLSSSGDEQRARIAGPVSASSAVASSGRIGRRLFGGVVVIVGLIAIGSAFIAWRTQERVRDLELELVRRQQEVQGQSTEARTLAREAQDGARDSAAKVALLEARLAEVSLQRTQLDELIQSLSRSRDENVIGDVEAALRVAMQQSAITGSAEPLVAALSQAEDRLTRYDQPRLDGVKRAIERDLERIKGTGVADVSVLNIRLDEAVRLVDGLPLVASADLQRERQRDEQHDSASVAAPASSPSAASGSAPLAPMAASASTATRATAAASATTSGSRAAAASGRHAAASSTATPAAALMPPPASAASAAPLGEAAPTVPGWSTVRRFANDVGAAIADELRALVRVTRIDHPEAMLISPDQAFFLRENLKLRLLNARLAVLSRQFDTAQADLQVARSVVDRYFDRNSRKVASFSDLLRQVGTQAKQIVLPRPDDTLTALAAAGARP